MLDGYPHGDHPSRKRLRGYALLQERASGKMLTMGASRRRNVIRLLIPSLILSVFVSPLICGSGLTTTGQAADCCRAMHDQCHKDGGNSPCCHHMPPAPAPVAVVSSSTNTSCAAPILATALLPAIATPIFAEQAFHRLFIPSTYSPPGGIHLFLLHSVLLI